MNDSDFAARVDACLDERCDPLDDPNVRDWLASRPDALEKFARQRSLLGELSAPTGRRHAARRSWPWLLAALLAVSAALALVEPRAPVPRQSVRFETAIGDWWEGSLIQHSSPSGSTLAWRTREVLLDTPTARLEIVESGHIRR